MTYEKSLTKIRDRVAKWAVGLGEKDLSLDEVIDQVAQLALAEGKRQAERRLNTVRHLVESDTGFEADCVKLDLIQGRKVDKKTKEFADLITRIYTLVHPYLSRCKHKDWEDENEKLMSKYETKN